MQTTVGVVCVHFPNQRCIVPCCRQEKDRWVPLGERLHGLRTLCRERTATPQMCCCHSEKRPKLRICDTRSQSRRIGLPIRKTSSMSQSLGAPPAQRQGREKCAPAKLCIIVHSTKVGRVDESCASWCTMVSPGWCMPGYSSFFSWTNLSTNMMLQLLQKEIVCLMWTFLSIR